MAGRGSSPSQDPVRRNKENTAERTKLVAGDAPVGPDLPEGVLPDGDDWHQMTRGWYEHWRTSPQASRMLSAPDWDFLLDTALLHHIMWTKGRWDFAGEVRLRVAKFGATVEDRLRLKAEIVEPEQFPVGHVPAGVSDLAERRSRLTS